MEEIIIPSKISLKEEKDNEALIVIEPCYSGYGTTMGNALRRILLSSLSGSAVSAVRIKGVDHEFSTISHVKEDVIQIISNIKELRFKVHAKKSVKLEMHIEGKKNIIAEDFEKNAEIEIVNPNLKIAESTDKKAKFDMEIIVQKGRGYLPVEQKDTSALEVGMIAIDSIFTPVLSVGFEVKNIRVGEKTDFDQLEINIKTDGTITPLEALVKSADILMGQLKVLSDINSVKELINNVKKEKELKEIEKEKKVEDKEEDVSISELNFSTRTFNALDKAKIRNINDLSKKKVNELLKLPGFGQTALNEVRKALKKYKLELVD